jgi:hypothetical protein
MDELQKAVELLTAGDTLAARRLLNEIVKNEPDNEQAWLWLASAVTDETRRRECLEQVTRINPDNQAARFALVALKQPTEPIKKPQLNPEPVAPGFQDAPSKSAPPLSESLPKIQKSAGVMPSSPAPQPPAQAPAPQPVKAISQTRILGNVWINPTGRRDKVVILHDNSLIVANPGRRAFHKFQGEVASGILHFDLLGKNVLFIPYNSILRVTANKYNARMDVQFRSGRKVTTEHVRFAGIGLRDELFQALRTDAGSRLEYYHRKLPGILRGLLFFLIAGLLGFWAYDTYITLTDVMAKLAQGWNYSILEFNQQFKAIALQVFNTLQPIGVAAIIGVFALLVLLWGIRRSMRPTEVMTLLPR